MYIFVKFCKQRAINYLNTLKNLSRICAFIIPEEISYFTMQKIVKYAYTSNTRKTTDS